MDVNATTATITPLIDSAIKIDTIDGANHPSTSTTSNVVIYIFLDIDGVLLPFPFPFNNEDNMMSGSFPTRTIQALSTIYEAFLDNPTQCSTEIRIILSSTWRVSSTAVQEIINNFQTYCIEKNPKSPLRSITSFFDTTDLMLHTTRQHEIYEWLIRNKVLHTATSSSATKRTHHSSNNAINVRFRQTDETAYDTTTIDNREKADRKVVAWIALDDEELIKTNCHKSTSQDYGRCFHNHCVRTVSSIGLTQSDAERAIELIQNQISKK